MLLWFFTGSRVNSWEESPEFTWVLHSDHEMWLQRLWLVLEKGKGNKIPSCLALWWVFFPAGWSWGRMRSLLGAVDISRSNMSTRETSPFWLTGCWGWLTLQEPPTFGFFYTLCSGHWWIQLSLVLPKGSVSIRSGWALPAEKFGTAGEKPGSSSSLR